MAVFPLDHINKKINDIKEKLGHLIAINSKQKWDLVKLERENTELKAANRQLEEKIRRIRKENIIIQKDFNKSKNFATIVRDKLTPTDGLAELKESVEQYIIEIDRCIEMLEDTM
ncbi:hypothetical protein [Persicitalea jodogahamensis]|uniref:Uncharacterized protein n=1 Tax=Persicitalea jodogahamensis TaxID=402147 RepID=A0A8J3D0L9_9BACT|nr:hypothetical protein [Persicitalea jodogahamensis]GHB58717.1 hypothetical protein GCM10007390_10290 [Persicitalea jodogahamensis]